MRNRRKGSSTVLVILLVVLLVSLGVLSVGVSNSSYKLSLRFGSQVKDYYRLESEADRLFAEVIALWHRGELSVGAMETLGCSNPRYFEDSNKVTFTVEQDGRTFRVGVIFDPKMPIITEWRESERVFEEVELEFGRIKK